MKKIFYVMTLMLAILLVGCADSKEQLQEKKDEIKKLQKQVDEKDDAISNLEDENSEKVQQIDALDKDLANLQKDSDDLQANYNDLQANYDDLQKNYDDLQKKYGDLQENYNKLQSDKKNVDEEYAAYKETMKPYEELDEKEAEARKIAAEKTIQEDQVRKQKEKEEAEKKKEEEEKKGYNTGITYDQLARTPDNYKNKKIKFKGEVVQVIEGDDEIDIRLAVNKDYDKVIYCGYSPNIVKSRVLEGDIITVYGTSLGLFSYESTLGGKITIPCAWIDKIDQ